MNVLVLGSGGREHALTWAISRSERCGELFVAPGNGGTAAIATNVPVNTEDAEAIIGFAHDHAIDLVVVGPEAGCRRGGRASQGGPSGVWSRCARRAS